jgi:hypothetical protein
VRYGWTEGRRRATSPSMLWTNGPAAARFTRLIWRAPYAAEECERTGSEEHRHARGAGLYSLAFQMIPCISAQ